MLKSIRSICGTLAGIPIVSETFCVLFCTAVVAVVYVGFESARAVIEMRQEIYESEDFAQKSIAAEPAERLKSEARFEAQRRQQQLAHAN